MSQVVIEVIALDVGDDGDPGVEIVEAAVEFACLGDEDGSTAEWLPPPSWGTVPPMTKLGWTAALGEGEADHGSWWWICREMPATATPNRSPMTIPSICAYLTVLRPRVEAATISQFLSGTAAVRTTRSGLESSNSPS